MVLPLAATILLFYKEIHINCVYIFLFRDDSLGYSSRKDKTWKRVLSSLDGDNNHLMSPHHVSTSHITISTFFLNPSAGADGGGVNWVTFHPPFLQSCIQ
jgi:hypothetical protein